MLGKFERDGKGQLKLEKKSGAHLSTKEAQAIRIKNYVFRDSGGGGLGRWAHFGKGSKSFSFKMGLISYHFDLPNWTSCEMFIRWDSHSIFRTKCYWKTITYLF